jgi:hypothetical protein
MDDLVVKPQAGVGITPFAASAASPNGTDVLANNLLKSLVSGVDFAVPDVDLDDADYQVPPATGPNYEHITRLTDDDLTTGVVGGTGMFDQIMVSLVNHLKVEYSANRIAGAEYTKAYIGVIGAALQTAQQYLLAKDAAYWTAVTVQNQARVAEIEVVKARVELEIQKATLVKLQFDANTASAQYGMIKMQIANADAEYAAQLAQTTGIVYTNTNILPANLAQLKEQTETIAYTNSYLLPGQKVGLDRTNENLKSQGDAIDYTNINILPQQKKLISEQAEAQRGQTADVRSDGKTVEGSVGKQKDLYDQQIKAYQFDSETKLVKMYSDSFISQLTVNEGVPVPEQFDQTSINNILKEMRSKLGFKTV